MFCHAHVKSSNSTVPCASINEVLMNERDQNRMFNYIYRDWREIYILLKNRKDVAIGVEVLRCS